MPGEISRLAQKVVPASLLFTEKRSTVMRILKLNLFPVPVHLHSGYGKLIFAIISPFLRNLRTLYIVWSLVRRRVIRRLTRPQTTCNLIKYRKRTFKRCVVVAFIFSIYFKPVLY